MGIWVDYAPAYHFIANFATREQDKPNKYIKDEEIISIDPGRTYSTA